MKPHDIYQDTVLLPNYIAMSVTSDPAEQVWLDERAQRHYRDNEYFRMWMRGKPDKSRDALTVYMKHWLAGLREHIRLNHTEHLAKIGWTV